MPYLIKIKEFKLIIIFSINYENEMMMILIDFSEWIENKTLISFFEIMRN